MKLLETVDLSQGGEGNQGSKGMDDQVDDEVNDSITLD